MTLVDEVLASTRQFMKDYAVPSCPGSIPAGRRVVKTTFQKGDTFPIGTGGTVLAVIPIKVNGQFAYFIEWDPAPGIPMFTGGAKVDEPE